MKLFNRNFNILFSGAFVKGLGSGIYSVAAMLLVLHLTGNVFYSGVTFFVISIPNIIGFLIAPLANYVSFKKGLISAEFLKSILLMSIPLLYSLDLLHVFYVIAIMFFTALISQFTYPIETTLIPTFVGEKNIVKANSLMQTLREGLDVVFLAVAGILIAFVGNAEAVFITAICHFITGILYCFFRFQVQDSSGYEKSSTSAWKTYKKDLNEGIQFIRGSDIFKKILGPAIMINFFFGGAMAVLPAFALFHGGSDEYYGYLLSAITVGSLIGAIITPKFKNFSFGKLHIVGFLVAGIAIIGVAYVPFWISLMLMPITFICITITNIILFSIIQQKVKRALVGRIITVVTSFAGLAMPLGGLIGGALGNINVIYPIVLAGLSMLFISLYFLIQPTLRKLPKADEVSFNANFENGEVALEPTGAVNK
ncbi:MFS transporter [Alkalihalobacillus sp. 1P02AB]|uniref:MFS transporter n=1 Tax=Alkalihalobacillus sp. 1P02AB TaxID=3132260 RepID=UPI0039A7570C